MNLPGNISADLKVGKGVDISKVITFGPPILGIAVSILIAFFIVWPKLSETLRLRTANEELEVRAQVLSSKAQFLASLDKVLLDSQLGAAERLLPSDKSTFTFIRQVESAAAANGVVLNKIDAAPGALLGGSASNVPAQAVSSPQDPASKVQVKIAITSTYASLLSFLSQVYGLSRVTGIRDLTIAAGSADQPSALRSTMIVDAYWKALPSELGSVESPVKSLTLEEEEVLKRVRPPEAGGAPPSAVPSVPTGRPDLFAPF